MKELWLIVAILLLSSCQSGSSVDSSQKLARSYTGTSLTSFWNGQSHLVVTATELGADFQMHFTQSVLVDDTLYSYFVKSPLFVDNQEVFGTYLATSSDGVSFVEYGEVLPIGGDILASFPAATMQHQIGYSDCGGWVSNPADGQGFQSFGAIAGPLPAGDYQAQFALYSEATDSVILNLEVADSTGAILAQRPLKGNDGFGFPGQFSTSLDFTLLESQEVEARVFATGAGSLCFRSASVRRGGPQRDDRIASFASVVHHEGTWYMVYEGASIDQSVSLGELRLATSTDGLNWTKDPAPLGIPLADWSSVNTGTPLLLRTNNQWYLFYHGFDQNTVQTGLLVGSDLHALSPTNSNLPILGNGPDWDSGTVGKRSIVYEAPWYYMVYEGSSPSIDGDFGKSRWGIGLARSQDLLNWEKFAGNPIIGPTIEGFGYDGPELIVLPDQSVHLFYRSPTGTTDRATFLPK
jgi:hypothetical protein